MNKVAIIQVRTASTRLPNKCILRIRGKAAIEHIIERVEAANLVDNICVGTTNLPVDDVIATLLSKKNITVYRGSENDVLDRFYQAAKIMRADVICRITADDLLKDPVVIDKIMQEFLNGSYDYVSNTITPTYPDGLDIEIFSFSALERAWKCAKLPSEREHVTPYIWKNPSKFKIFNVAYCEDLSHMRWTLDRPEDWVFVQQVYEHLYEEGKIFLMEDVLNLLKDKPYLEKYNNQIVKNEGYIKSIKEDDIYEKID